MKLIRENPFMKNCLIAIVLISSFGIAHAQNSCMAKVAEKKLAGVAKTSFLKKCENEARAICENDDVSKRLGGAARAAHIKKCVRDSVGS